MINILWVEDEFSEQKKTEWFNHRNVCVKTNFLAAKEAINNSLEQFDVAVLDINLENSEHSPEIQRLAEHFKITEQAFLEESGMNLFLSLLEKGFPKEQIVFLTANADDNISLVEELRKAFTQKDDDRFDLILAEIQLGLGEEQINQCAELINAENLAELFEYLESYYKGLIQDETKNTYNRFCEAYKRCRIEPPEAINKNLNEAKHSLNTWLKKHEENDYLLLRRGIIEGSDFLKEHLKKDDSNLQFRQFIKEYEYEEEGIKYKSPTIEIETTEIENYLATLAQFLSLKEADEKNTLMQYRLFLRTLAHEWEENISEYRFKKNTLRDFNLILDIYTFAKIMKKTRNWVSHANLLEPLNPQFIAFLFLINMRAMFKLPKEVQAYERILLNCICKTPVEKISLETLTNHIEYAENNVNGILDGLSISEYQKDKDGNDKLYKGEKILNDFGDKVNDIYRQNSGNPDAEKHDFKELLFQNFWVNQKDNLSNLTAPSNEFLPTLARHIYKRSF